MEPVTERIWTKLKKEISVYIRLKWRLLKLTAIERSAFVVAFLSFGLLVLLSVFFTLLFLLVALGFYLGELLNSLALGFFMVGMIYLLFTLLIWCFRKYIRFWLMNIVITVIQIENHEEETTSRNPSRENSGGAA